MKQKIVLIIAAGMGLLAFILTHFYLEAERRAIYGDAERAQIVLAREDFPSGHTLRADDMVVQEVFARGLSDQVVRAENRSALVGRTLQYPLRQGTGIQWIHVGTNLRELTGLAPTIRSGMRAISIPVSAETAVSGLVRANDTVDIIGTFSFTDPQNPAEMETVTFTVLQDVTILATGQDTARVEQQIEITGGGRRRSSYNTVTIAVFPQEAELIEFAKNVTGSLALALRNPNDRRYFADAPPIDFDTLQRELPRLNRERRRILGGEEATEQQRR